MAVSVTLLIENFKNSLDTGEITPRQIPIILGEEGVDVTEFKRLLYSIRLFETETINRKREQLGIMDTSLLEVRILNEKFEVELLSK